LGRVPAYHKTSPKKNTIPNIPRHVAMTICLNATGSFSMPFVTFIPKREPTNEPVVTQRDPTLIIIFAKSSRFRTASSLWLISSCVVRISPRTRSREFVRENAVCRWASKISSGSSDSVKSKVAVRENVDPITHNDGYN